MKLPLGVYLDKDGYPYVIGSGGRAYRVTKCCYAAVTIDQDAGLPYCKKCYETVSMHYLASPNL